MFVGVFFFTFSGLAISPYNFLLLLQSSFMEYNSRALIPYAQALLRLPAHIQQLDMESNGKRINNHGVEIDYPVGEVDFGEPGTNSQHSFFQLIHQGQTIPVDFLGFGEAVGYHAG